MMLREEKKKFVVYLPIVGEGKKPVKQRTLKNNLEFRWGILEPEGCRGHARKLPKPCHGINGQEPFDARYGA